MQIAQKKKPPAAFAGGGLGQEKLVNPVRQASSPACALEPIIRMAGIGRSMHRTSEKLVLALEVCIPLISLEQRQGKLVKNAELCGTDDIAVRPAITLG